MPKFTMQKPAFLQAIGIRLRRLANVTKKNFAHPKKSKYTQKVSRKLTTTSAAIILSIAIFAGYLFISQPEKVAAWFDYNWAYRTIYVLTNSDSAISAERKIKLEIDTEALITAGKLQADCDDARFTDQDGKILEYFIDTATGACNTNSTDFYVKVSAVPTNKLNIYLYYGNPSATQGRSSDFFAIDTLGENLKGYWKLDESSANTCTGGSNDSCDSAFTNDGAWNNNTTNTTGKISNAVTLDGTDDYVQVSGLLGSLGTISVSGWAKTSATDTSGSEIVSIGDYIVLRLENTGYLSGHYYNGTTWSTISNTTDYRDGNWHHFVYVVNPSGSSQKLYADGSEVATASETTIISYATQGSNTFIGKHGNASSSYDFNGQIDDVRVYGKALTAGEVTKIYNSGNGVGINVPVTFTPSATSAQTEEKTPGPIGAWKFDEASGTTTYDSSAQANHGVMNTGGATLTTLEQEISLLNTNYTTTSTSYAPTDNSLGLAYYDSSKYTSPQVFFESVVKQSQTNTTSNDVGFSIGMDCLTVDDCKIAYYDTTAGAVRFMDCDNASCSSGTITIIDGTSGCVITNCETSITAGDYLDLDCPTADDCKIVYNTGSTDTFFVDCDNATCSSGTRTLLDGASGCVLTGCASRTTGYDLVMDCPAADDCKIAYFLSGNDLILADCGNATCTSGTTTILDGSASCVLTGCNTSIAAASSISIFCLSATDCKLAYFDDTNNDLRFVDCDNADCTSGTVNAIDGNASCGLTGCSTTDTVGVYVSMYCISGNDCKLAYHNSTDSDMYFADCDDATCTTGTLSLLEGNAACVLTGCHTSYAGGQYNSIDCSQGASDCKIAYYRGTSGDAIFADCDTATCSSGTITMMDGNSGCALTGCLTGIVAGQLSNLICLSATDCKIAYLDNTNEDLIFVDCNNATCSSGTTTIADGDGAFANDVGQYADVDCTGGSSDCKLAYYDATDGNLLFFDCDDAACNTGTLVVLDGDPLCSLTNCSTTATRGGYVDLDCSNGVADCKLAYRSATGTDMYFADCDSATCNVGTTTLIDGDSGCTLTGCSTSQATGTGISMDCSLGATDCRIAFQSGTSDLYYADCDTATCSSGTRTFIDGNSGCTLTGCFTNTATGSYTAIDCVATDDCKIAYYESTNTALLLADCDDTACTTGTITVLDGTTGCTLTGCASASSSGAYPDMECLSTTDCKISYDNGTGNDIYFADCDTATCSSGSTTLINGNTGCTLTGCVTNASAIRSSLSCDGGASDCKVVMYHSGDLALADCDTATCSSGTLTVLDGSGSSSLTNSSTSVSIGSSYGASVIDCAAGATDCKIAYYNSSALYQDLHIADCDTATCSSGTATLTDDGSDRIFLQLVNSSGTAVPNGIFSPKVSSYTRLRTVALSPTSETNYTIRVASTDSTNITADVAAARLVIPQSGSITATQTQVEVGNNETTTATSYTPLTDKKIYRYDANKFTPTPTAYFEATLANDTGGQVAYAALYTDGASCSSVVSGSEVTVTGTTWTRVRSSAITLSDDADYMVCIKAGANTAQIANARIILDQTSSVSAVETLKNMINTAHTDTDSTYTDQSGLNFFDPAYFPTANYYFESDLKTSAGTGYAQLYNASDSAAIASSEVTTTSTTYERKRSNALTMPELAKTLDAQLKNSASNTTTAAAADLVIQAGSPPSSEPTRKLPSNCIANNCIEFNGSDNSIKVTNTTALDLNEGLASGLTFAAWIKVSSDGEGDAGQIFWKGDNTYLRTTNESDGYVDLEASLDLASSDATVSITDGLAINTWHYVAFGYTDDGDDEISVYIDGRLKGTSSNGAGAPAADSNDWLIGGITTANFNGLLDEIKLYPYERTASQITLDYNAKGSAEGVTAQIGGVTPTNQSANPVAYYKFDENTGTSAKDESTNANTATLNNGALWEPGKYGSGVRLDGSDDDVTAVSSSTLNIGTNDFTLMAWVKGNNMANGDVIIGKTNGGSAASDYGFHFSVYDSLYPTLHFATSATGLTKIQGTTALSNGQWYHVAVVVDRDSSTNTKVYLNGVPITSTVSNLATNTGSITNSVQLAIGNESDGSYNWDGFLDEVKIYNYARSQAEILQDMSAGAPPTGMGLQDPLMHLKFDDGYGTTAQDSSENNYDGTLTAMSSPATSTSGWSNDGKFGKAISVDGSDDYVTTTVPWQNSGSIAVWAYPTSTGTDWVSPIGWKYAPSSGGYTLIDVGSGGTKHWRAVFKPGSTAEANLTGTAVTINTWQHVLMTWSESAGTYTITLYVNGVKQGTTTWVGTPDTANIGALYVGTAGQSANNNFTGRLDEAKVYSYALSETEAKQEYNHGMAFVGGATSTASDGTSSDNSTAREYCVPGDTATCNPPVAEWRIDEGTGTGTQPIKDTTGNGNHLSMSGSMPASSWVPGKLGKAIQTDGIDDNLCSDTDVNGTCDPNTNLQLTGNMTFSAWINPQSTDPTTDLGTIVAQRIGGAAISANNALYQIDWDKRSGGNSIRYIHEYGSASEESHTFAFALTANQWNHVSFSRDITANTVSFYGNGKLIETWTYTNDPSDGSSGIFRLSDYADNGSWTLKSKFDQVRIYNYARTPAQIAWEYNRGAPIVHYKLDECQGTTAYNSALNSNGEAAGNNGTISIGATGTNTSVGSCKGSSGEAWKDGAVGKFNGSLEFDGTDDYITINSPSTISSFATNANLLSFSFWFKPANTSQEAYLLSGRLSSTNNKWWMVFYPASGTYNGISMRVNGSTSVNSPSGTSWSADTWYHVVGVYDGTNITLYRDGKVLTSGSSSAVTSIDELIIGNVSGSGANPYNGQIDDVRIYNYNLTAAQVKEIYNNSAVNFR